MTRPLIALALLAGFVAVLVLVGLPRMGRDRVRHRLAGHREHRDRPAAAATALA